MATWPSVMWNSPFASIQARTESNNFRKQSSDKDNDKTNHTVRILSCALSARRRACSFRRPAEGHSYYRQAVRVHSRSRDAEAWRTSGVTADVGGRNPWVLCASAE